MDIAKLLNNYWILALLVIWTLVWKGLALWKSARRSEKKWFIALLILNTLGILEIFYIFFIDRKESAAIQIGAREEDLMKKKII